MVFPYEGKLPQGNPPSGGGYKIRTYEVTGFMGTKDIKFYNPEYKAYSVFFVFSVALPFELLRHEWRRVESNHQHTVFIEEVTVY